MKATTKGVSRVSTWLACSGLSVGVLVAYSSLSACQHLTNALNKEPTTAGETKPGTTKSAKTEDPIDLFNGSATETETDVTLPGVSFAWSHTRSYSSGYATGEFIQGERWQARNLTYFIRQSGSNIDLYMDDIRKVTFTGSGQTYTAPGDFLATLTPKTVAGKTHYELKMTQTGETFLFNGFTYHWGESERGLLKEHTDRYGLEKITYTYTTYTYGARATTITTSQGWSVSLSYISHGLPNQGRISQIDVRNGNGHVTQRVKYTYYQSGQGYSTDCGSTGDLIMVQVMKAATADTLKSSPADHELTIQKTTMYRYFKKEDYGSQDEVLNHQLKMVLSPASVVQAMADGSKTASQLLATADSGAIGSRQLADYANVTYTYYSSNFNTTSVSTSDGGVGGDNENLQTKYGTIDLDEKYFVRSQTIKKDYQGFLGHRTYFYTQMSGLSGSVSEVARVVVEDTADTGTRRIYGLNIERQTLRDVFVDNPSSGTPKYWCTSFIRGTQSSPKNFNQIVEKRNPSAHAAGVYSDVQSGMEVRVAKFLKPQTGSNDADTLSANQGIVNKFYYDNNAYVIDTTIKKGSGGIEYVISSARYGEDNASGEASYLPKQKYDYPTETAYAANGSHLTQGYLTSFAYTFHGNPENKQQLKAITTTRAAIESSQNGSGTDIVTREYYDDRGRLRWTKDGEGSVSYYSYNPYTGGLAYLMVDVNTGSLPSAITNGISGKSIAWSGSAPTGFESSGSANLQVVTKFEYDTLGRPIKTEDAGGMITATAYVNMQTKVYPGWNVSTHVAALPIKVNKTDADGLTLEILAIDPAGITVGYANNLPTGVDSGLTQEDYLAWTTYSYNHVTALVESKKAYHTIPPTGSGSLGANYYCTFYHYDSLGRRTHEITTVSGTSTADAVEQVTAWVHDTCGRMIEVYRGVSDAAHDMGANYANMPSMAKMSANFYDEASPGSGVPGVGDGLITSTINYYDAANPSNHAKTMFHHNWRGQVRGIEGGESPFVVQDVDNYGRATAVAAFTAAPSWSTVISTADFADATATNRGTLSKIHYDNMGRVFRSEEFEIDANGTKGNALVTNNYYDSNSNLVATYSPSGGGVEYAYDKAGRQFETRVVTELASTKYSGGAYQYRDPQPLFPGTSASGGDDKVVQITRKTFDSAGNPIAMATLEANHNDTDGLNLTTNTDYVQTVVYHWYDATHRLTASADYGACHSSGQWAYSALTVRPSSAPARSDSILVTSYAYAKNRLDAVTDPKNISTKYEYDDLGRFIRTKEALGTAQERWTLTQHDGLSNVVKQIADIGKDDTYANGVWTSTANSQVTEYTYADPHNASLLTKIQYPDSISSEWDAVTMTYGLDGRMLTRTAQKAQAGDTATVITFDYDEHFRRMISQRVTTLGTGVDNSVQSIGYSYDSLGRRETVTSYSDNATTTPVNQVRYAYNAFGALDGEYQDHAGVVDTQSSPATAWSYDTTADGGVFTKAARLANVTYPNGRRVHYTYGASGSVDDLLSRTAAINMDDAGSPGDPIVQYSYNGVMRTVIRDMPTPQIRLDHFGGTSGTYDGFDRFGRVAKQRWNDYDTSSEVFDIRHGYDSNSNRLYADRQVYRSFSHVYSYDNLNRLIEFKAGQIDASQTDVADHWKFRHQRWTLDIVGNQTEVADFGVDPWYKATFNKANEHTLLETKAAGKPFRVDDQFSTDTSSNYEKPGVLDAFGINGGIMTITSIGQDTLGGHQEDEGRFFVLIGEAVGSTQLLPRWRFPAGTQSGYAGLVFGYKSPNDYWMFVSDIADQKAKLYHVVNGEKSLIALRNWSVPVATWIDFSGYHYRKCLQEIPYTFADGYPAGKVGLITNVEGVSYDYFRVPDDSMFSDAFGRWKNYVSLLSLSSFGGSKWMNCDGGWTSTHFPRLLKNIRLDRFDVTFAARSDANNRRVSFIFNAKDIYEFNTIRFYHHSKSASSGRQVIDGNLVQTVTGTSNTANMPTLTAADDLWVRVRCDGTYVKLFLALSENDLDSVTAADQWCFRSGNFKMDGGGIGFGSFFYRIDKLTVRSDPDGDGVFDKVETWDDFEGDAGSYAQETPVYDALGNLTYDGQYQYSYDAWNRLTTVRRAYRDANGTLQTGSVVATMSYDGVGRRIVKAVANSADWDCVYHYYYDGQQMIEERNGSDQVVRQHVWGLGYVDELCQVSINDDPLSGSACDTHYYAMQDANYNVMGLVDSDGLLVERYEYTPYGQRTVFKSAGANDPLCMSPVLETQRVRLGSVDMPYGLCDIGHQGLMHDKEFGLVYNRARYLHPTLGRFMQRDPLGYIDGMSLYEYVGSNAFNALDPMGLNALEEACMAESRRSQPLIRMKNNAKDLHRNGLRNSRTYNNYHTYRSVGASGVEALALTAATIAPVAKNLDEMISGETVDLDAPFDEGGKTRKLCPKDRVSRGLYAGLELIGLGVTINRFLGGLPGKANQIMPGSLPPGRNGALRSVAGSMDDAAGGAPRSAAKYVYDARVGRYRDVATGRFAAARDLPWPKNGGFAQSARQTVRPDTILDRYGSPSGRFLGKPGTSVSARGMAAGTEGMPYTQYRVLKPFDAQVGPAAAVPEFGATGGATQYLPGKSVQWLVDNGFLGAVK